MPQSKISITLDEDLLDDVEELVGDQYDNRSEAIRELVRKGLDLDDVVDELQDEVEHLEAKRDDLRRQLQEVRAREDDVDELVNYVDEQRSIERRQAEAGLVDRARWWLFGMDVDDESE